MQALVGSRRVQEPVAKNVHHSCSDERVLKVECDGPGCCAQGYGERVTLRTSVFVRGSDRAAMLEVQRWGREESYNEAEAHYRVAAITARMESNHAMLAPTIRFTVLSDA